MPQAYLRRTSVWVSLTTMPVSAHDSTRATGMGKESCSARLSRGAGEVRRRDGSENGKERTL